jgi:hypothetical protein
MAVTEPDHSIAGQAITRRSVLRVSSLAASALLFPATLAAERSEDVMRVINYVATALTAGNGTDALRPFDPALTGYATLSGYFEALSVEVTVRSDVDLLELCQSKECDPKETASDSEPNALLRWTLDLRERVSNDELQRRERQVRVRFVPAPEKAKYGLWKIAAFDDIELFNPSIA